MLRVGLTGGLGSGKSTVAAMLERRGAHVFYADEIGRELMRPGQEVYAAIVDRFGTEVVQANGELDRGKLAQIAFTGGRVEQLNAIVHPAVIERQREMTDLVVAVSPEAVIVVESALIFEANYREAGSSESDGWRRRFDRLILVIAPEELKIERFVERAFRREGAGTKEIAALREEARLRLARQMQDEAKAPFCDYVLRNSRSAAELEAQVEALWPVLQSEARSKQGA